jgi:hypothetical protein
MTIVLNMFQIQDPILSGHSRACQVLKSYPHVRQDIERFAIFLGRTAIYLHIGIGVAGPLRSEYLDLPDRQNGRGILFWTVYLSNLYTTYTRFYATMYYRARVEVVHVRV